MSCARRPGLGDRAGGGGDAGHVAGDVAEEEGHARVALRDAGEADLLAGLAVVVGDGRDGKAAGVGRPRGVDEDAVGAPACGRLPPPADEGQALAHEAALGVLAAEVGQALAGPLGGHPGPGAGEPRVGELPPVPGVAVGEAGEHVERQQRPHRVGLGVAARVGAGHQPARAQERVQQERVAERHGERRASGAGVAPPRPLDALRRGPELARRQVVGEQAPGPAPVHAARPVHDPPQVHAVLLRDPGAVPHGPDDRRVLVAVHDVVADVHARLPWDGRGPHAT